jgi:hypothetical protein
MRSLPWWVKSRRMPCAPYQSRSSFVVLAEVSVQGSSKVRRGRQE